MLEQMLGEGQRAPAHDPYISDVKVLLHFDNSLTNVVGAGATSGGSAAYASVGKFKQGINLSNGGWITMPSSIMAGNGLMGSSSPWTVEFWMMLNTYPGNGATIVPGFGENQNTSSGSAYSFGIGGTGLLSFGFWTGSTTSFSQGTTTAPLNVFHHLAMCSNGTTLTYFLNGNLEFSRTRTSEPGTKYTPSLGYWNNLILKGVVDEFRYTNGVNRYPANFTPPRYAFPNQ